MDYPVSKPQQTRWWDWPAVLLLIAAIYVAATRLNATNWTDELNTVQTIAILGVIAGLALGKSTFSPGVVRIFAFVYGGFVIFWQIGLTYGRGVLWPERMISMGNRSLVILDQIFQQKPVVDNLFFNILMGILFWIISAYAGYSLIRYGSAWKAVIPAGIAMIVIQAYDPYLSVRTWFLAGYIFLSLLLVARMHFLHLKYRWNQDGTYMPPYVSLDSLRLGLITTVILVLFAWTVPAIASAVPQAEQIWLNATQPWMDVRNKLSNVFYSLQASVGVVTDFYGETLPLGRGNPLSDTTIMTIEAPPRPSSNVRYYWRSRIYDTYDGNWSSTLPVIDFVSPDEFNLNLPEYENRATSFFSITTIYPIQNLQTPTQPIWVSRPANAYFAVNSDGTIDLSHLKADPVLMSGDTYRVEASLTSASQKELRESGTDYPDWVTARYLQLPDNITPRTIELAESIVGNLDNPYDKTQAITDFLRTSLKYSETVPTPPAGQEPIDWVLFDHKQAFCNYYATAEIIMLRALGIPARMAVGYAEGERTSVGTIEDIPTLQAGGQNVPQEIQIAGDIFTVRHKDAHAWPEVYFPSIGWVEFEPTASQQPIIRPLGLILESSSQEPPTPDFEQLQERASQRLSELSAQGRGGQNVNIGGLQIDLRPIIFSMAVLVLVGLIFLIRFIRTRRGSPPLPVQIESGLEKVGIQSPRILTRWAHYAKLSPLAKAYHELNRALSRLGMTPEISATPSERAQELVLLLPVSKEPVEAVVVPYQNSIYGNQPETTEKAQTASKEIRKISYFAKIQQFFARFQEPKRDQKQKNIQ